MGMPTGRTENSGDRNGDVGTKAIFHGNHMPRIRRMRHTAALCLALGTGGLRRKKGFQCSSKKLLIGKFCRKYLAKNRFYSYHSSVINLCSCTCKGDRLVVWMRKSDTLDGGALSFFRSIGRITEGAEISKKKVCRKKRHTVRARQQNRRMENVVDAGTWGISIRRLTLKMIKRWYI